MQNLKTSIEDINDHNNLLKLLSSVFENQSEAFHLQRLILMFNALLPPKDPFNHFSNYLKLKEKLFEQLIKGDGESIYESFLNMYVYLHRHQLFYTLKERERIDRVKGYWCHAGGISPILKAAPFIKKHTISCDFGSGNGLQCLLIQKLFPHQKSIQIEISSQTVKEGQAIQKWLDIPLEKVEWITGDIFQNIPREADFIYLYRPVHPQGPGEEFYYNFSKCYQQADHPLVIFSVADCLGPFLPSCFKIFYSDGHLTCYKKD